MSTSASSEEEFEQLRTTVAQLKLLDSFKSQQIVSLEKKYGQTLQLLNDYIDQLHKILNIKSTDPDSMTIDQLIEVLSKDNVSQLEDFIIIPRKLVKLPTVKATLTTATKGLDIQNETPKTEANKRSNKNNHSSKFTCSFCKERGHKRASCPMILYKNT